MVRLRLPGVPPWPVAAPASAEPSQEAEGTLPAGRILDDHTRALVAGHERRRRCARVQAGQDSAAQRGHAR